MSVDELCRLFNLGHCLSSPQKVPGGHIHTLWHTQTDTGEYAIKELNPLLAEDLKTFEVAEQIAKAFAEKQIPAVTSVSMAKLHNSYYIIYPWIKGRVIGNNEITRMHVEKIASILARIHLLRLSFPNVKKTTRHIYSNENFIQLIMLSSEKHLPFANDLKKHLSSILSWNLKGQHAFPVLEKNQVISHGDLDPKNVLWENDHPLLIDWESARLLNPTVDLLESALDWSHVSSGNINFDLLKTFFQKYIQMHGPFEDDFKIAFEGVVGNLLCWLAFHINQVLEGKSSSLPLAILFLKIFICLIQNEKEIYRILSGVKLR